MRKSSGWLFSGWVTRTANPKPDKANKYKIFAGRSNLLHLFRKNLEFIHLQFIYVLYNFGIELCLKGGDAVKIINRIMISSALLVFLSLVSLLVGLSIIIILSPAPYGKEVLIFSYLIISCFFNIIRICVYNKANLSWRLAKC